MKTGDAFEMDLRGSRLIEASAGTGKTYTITTLFLRLLVEQGMQVDQILVVTFTNKATAELRDRIRLRLRQAVSALDAGEAPGDRVLQQLVERSGPDARPRLAAELRRFDEASIFTIHGFCQRMLQDNAFESDVPFDADLSADDAPLLAEVVGDYWAREVYDAPELVVRYLAEQGITPDSLLSLAGQATACAELEVLPEPLPVELADPMDEYVRIQAEAAALWGEHHEAIARMLREDKGLSRGAWSLKTLDRRLAGFAVDLAPGAAPATLSKDFPRLTQTKMRAAAKKGCAPLEHPLFEACERVLEAHENLIPQLAAHTMNLKLGLLDYARQQMRQRRAAANVLSYDDLLGRLDRALQSSRGEDLVRVVRERFRAALIDEFQDTDPIQDRIFARLFGEGATLFLIGDPKQAIYGFRQADVHTYLAAAERTADAAEGKYTLDTNWRADPALIDVVNRIHGRVRAPFVDERISFEPVGAPDGRENELGGTGRLATPLEVLFVSREGRVAKPTATLSKDWVNRRLPDWIADEIARLLDPKSKITIEGRPVEPGDIAVLIRRNAEAAPLQEALRERSIPSVLYSDSSVYDTAEAEELQRLLGGLANPLWAGALRVALATTFCGVSGEALHELSQDEDRWQEWSQRFHGWAEQWRRRGFLYAFRRMLEELEVAERLLSLPDGERRLTNVLHLSELLQQAEAARGLGPIGLASWLSQVREGAVADAEAGQDARQVRMESDAKAVQILTLHKSKGLEFPVVYCPYLWEMFRLPGKNAPIRFHDPEDGNRLKLDLGSPERERHQELWEREELAEQMRVAYVALTRARHRTVVVWGAFSMADRSALAQLFHQPEEPGEDPALAARLSVAGATDEQLLDDLDRLARDCGPSLVVTEMPEEPGPAYRPTETQGGALAHRTTERRLDRSWHMVSFSGMASRGQELSAAAALGRDLDEQEATAKPEGAGTAPPAEPVTLHEFPRGAAAGNLVHEVFEHLDFVDPEAPARLVPELVRRHGFEDPWAAPLIDAVGEILQTPLGDAGGPRLADVTRERRLTELEFLFPLAQTAHDELRTPVDAKRMARVLAAHGDARAKAYAEYLSELAVLPVRGYLRGFVDLVFEHEGRWYVVDYKTNYLGPFRDDYRAERMLESMVEHHYPLQYHLYTVALHRYLARRLAGYDYERCFGGVFYLFVRGMSPQDPTRGVYADRPSASLVEALSDVLAGEGADR